MLASALIRGLAKARLLGISIEQHGAVKRRLKEFDESSMTVLGAYNTEEALAPLATRRSRASFAAASTNGSTSIGRLCRSANSAASYCCRSRRAPS